MRIYIDNQAYEKDKESFQSIIIQLKIGNVFSPKNYEPCCLFLLNDCEFLNALKETNKENIHASETHILKSYFN